MHKDSMNKDILTLLEKGSFDSYGSGNGDGNCSGNGSGYGDTGNIWGCGDGWGWSDGNGNILRDDYDNGNGRGDGRGIVEINGMKVYDIDRVPTAVEAVFGAYAKGYTVGEDFRLVPCYIAMDGSSLAHGETLKEAFCDAMAKEMEKLPEDERINRFITEHPDPSEILPSEELFYMHHTLTGSCMFGRKEFCRKNGIDLESSMSISEFLRLTGNEYGGEVIGKIREEYLRRG